VRVQPSGALVLASASPRRRELLAGRGLAFEILAPEVDESLPAEFDPRAGACLLARRKAARACELWAQRAPGRAAWVLAADTIVAVPRAGGGFELLGKPLERGDARRMLALLSGTRHLVVTGVCARALPVERASAAGAAAPPSEACEHADTWVHMRALSAAELDAYAASGEGLDKAGGYAIQEGAGSFVTRLEGARDNVVGLPLELALELLARVGAPAALLAPRTADS
jgi:septum formation protein